MASTVWKVRLQMHCPAGKAHFIADGAAAIADIALTPAGMPACTIEECSPSRISVSNTLLDQGAAASDQLGWNLDVAVSAGGSLEIKCDGSASGWFEVEGLPGRYACPPAGADEPVGLRLTDDNSTTQAIYHA